MVHFTPIFINISLFLNFFDLLVCLAGTDNHSGTFEVYRAALALLRAADEVGAPKRTRRTQDPGSEQIGP